MKTWDMVSGRLDKILQPETETRNLPYQAGKEGWYTLSCEDRPRFLFQLLPQLMSVWWRGPDGLYTPFAELLLPLKPRAAWTSHRMKGRSYILQNASCTSDDIQTGEGRVEALRVDFTEYGELCHTMWFTRKEGLVRWDGVEIAPICRFPGSGPHQQLQAAALANAGYGRVDNLTRFALVDCEVPPPVPAR